MKQSLSAWDARTQLTEFLYRALIKLTMLSESGAWSAVTKAMIG